MQPLSLSRFLTRLIWLCVLPLMVLAVYLAVRHAQTLEDQRDQQARNQVQNVATAIDRYLDAQIAALQMLATSPTRNSKLETVSIMDSQWNKPKNPYAGGDAGADRLCAAQRVDGLLQRNYLDHGALSFLHSRVTASVKDIWATIPISPAHGLQQVFYLLFS